MTVGAVPHDDPLWLLRLCTETSCKEIKKILAKNADNFLTLTGDTDSTSCGNLPERREHASRIAVSPAPRDPAGPGSAAACGHPRSCTDTEPRPEASRPTPRATPARRPPSPRAAARHRVVG